MNNRIAQNKENTELLTLKNVINAQTGKHDDLQEFLKLNYSGGSDAEYMEAVEKYVANNTRKTPNEDNNNNVRRASPVVPKPSQANQQSQAKTTAPTVIYNMPTLKPPPSSSSSSPTHHAVALQQQQQASTSPNHKKKFEIINSSTSTKKTATKKSSDDELEDMLVEHVESDIPSLDEQQKKRKQNTLVIPTVSNSKKEDISSKKQKTTASPPPAPSKHQSLKEPPKKSSSPIPAIQTKSQQQPQSKIHVVELEQNDDEEPQDSGDSDVVVQPQSMEVDDSSEKEEEQQQQDNNEESAKEKEAKLKRDDIALLSVAKTDKECMSIFTHNLVYEFMCYNDKKWKEKQEKGASKGVAMALKSQNAVNYLAAIKRILTGYVGDNIRFTLDQSKYDRVYSLMLQTADTKNIQFKVLPAADTCCITSEKLKKGTAVEVTFTLDENAGSDETTTTDNNKETLKKPASLIVRTMSEKWFKFFQHWIMLLMLAKEGLNIIVKLCKEFIRKNPQLFPDAELGRQTAVLASNQPFISNASKIYRKPLSFFYHNFINDQQRSQLVNVYKVHPWWFQSA